MEQFFTSWKERAEVIEKLWKQREKEIIDERAKLKMARLFDQTISDLIEELSVEAAYLAEELDSLGEGLSRQWPGGVNKAYRLKNKSALLKQAYRSHVEKK